MNSFFVDNLNRIAEGGWLGQKLSQFQTTLTKNMKSQAKRLLRILPCLSNDKFKYPTNDKNSDPGLI